jgi:hypothetical protein
MWQVAGHQVDVLVPIHGLAATRADDSFAVPFTNKFNLLMI